jgi:hypothetical protein
MDLGGIFEWHSPEFGMYLRHATITTMCLTYFEVLVLYGVPSVDFSGTLWLGLFYTLQRQELEAHHMISLLSASSTNLFLHRSNLFTRG